MQILLNVPSIVPLEWLSAWLLTLQANWNWIIREPWAVVADKWMEWRSGNTVVWPLVGLLVVFWPVLFSVIMAFVTAGTWLLWLATSMLLGVVQVVYALYHFMMIAVDICGLSLMKTYAMVRNYMQYTMEASSNESHRFPLLQKKSRRRVWRQALEQAETYENFLKIRIRPKRNRSNSAAKSSSVDSALPPATKSESLSPSLSRMPRVRSFHERSMSGTSSLSVRRRHSVSSLAESSDTPVDPDPAMAEELGEKTANLLVATTKRLEEARLQDPDENKLKYLLCSVVKRNHLNLDDVMVDNARSVALTGEYGLSSQTRQAIRAYYEQVEKGLHWLAEAPIVAPKSANKNGNAIAKNLSLLEEQDEEASPVAQSAMTASAIRTGNYIEEEPPTRPLAERITLVRKMKQNMGRTALMLSGGGAQAMYHTGLIRSLIESKLYGDIKVVSGTSGGSITAAMCAMKTPEELLDHVCVPNVSTDYMSNGEMKRQNIRWFPKPIEMASYWLKHKLLVKSSEFRRTCQFYYGSVTFEEAFAKTGKHVCITVSASRAHGRSAQRLLLNHISTPHVTIASAVAASCALPGVMAPTKLICKNSNGELEPFEVDGVEWIDGSVQADLPFQRISTLFAVSSFIVSQTNFHIVPFLNKAHHPSQKSLYWRLFQTIEWDIRSRALKLSRLGLFPQFFGQDISKVFKQRYHGNLTIVPQFTRLQTIGLAVLANPTFEDMEGYLKYGQIAAWPHLNAIRDMIRLERALDDCLSRLEERLRAMHGGDSEWSFHDDVDSIASSSAAFGATSGSGRVRIIGRPSRDDSSSIYQKMNHLQEENQNLKHELQELKKLLKEKGAETKEKETPSKRNGVRSPVSDGGEGHLWNLVLGKLPHGGR